MPRRTVAFFGLAYLFSWSVWLPMLTAPDSLQWLHYVGSLGPLMAAFIMRWHDGGRDGVVELFSQMLRWRVAPQWILLAVGFPLALFVLGTAVSTLLHAPVDWSEFLGSKEFAHVGWVLIPIEIIFFGFGEETGWRGYAIPSLQTAGWTPYAATTMFAVGWAGWHLPLFFYPYGLQSLGLLLIPGWIMSLLFGAYLTTFLFNSARCSILVIAVFHGMVDIVSISRAATDITLIVVNAGLIAAAVGVTIATAPQLTASAAARRFRKPPRSSDHSS
ncbi:CPBP family intramembrane metalloprotease [Gordonia terrae]|uniref:CPBP family intramembrane metalloprotease n=2 Tax=Gordonia terrae TaxID=2055 RepID=A0A2I1R4A5_9ACTN|nr:CPBP family intramembrane metalloprotease [Gordonia terrae]